MNRFGDGLSRASDPSQAIAEAVAQALAPLDGVIPDLCVAFCTPDLLERMPELPERLEDEVGARHLVGCTGAGVAGGGEEVEEGSALSLMAAQFDRGRVRSFDLSVKVEYEDPEQQRVDVAGLPWIEPLNAEAYAQRRMSAILLADPGTFPAVEWLEVMNRDYPGLPIVGGLASGSDRGGTLFHGRRTLEGGAVGLLLEDVTLKTLVSQGCAPVGRSMAITRCEGNVIEQLAGKTPMEQIDQLYEETTGRDRKLVERAMDAGGLFLGQVLDERISKPSRGDFLVRGVLGTDPATGALALGEVVRRGRTIRFHVRDAISADEELRDMLSELDERWTPGAALLFTCNGRGQAMFGSRNHDVGALRERFGNLPLAGFFAAGELGPVGQRNFVHGFTASLAFFAPD